MFTFTAELFDSITLQNAEIRTVTNSLLLNFKNSAKGLFLNRLSQIDEILKYDNSRKQPYLALGDRLTNFLKQPDTILITCGYSFGDEHINERITTALKSNVSAHIYVLNYDIEWTDGKKSGYSFSECTSLCKMAKRNNKISIYSSRNAVIGSQFGTWKLKREPDKEDAIQVNWYFDVDGYTSLSDEINVEKINEEQWTGEGELIIPDFSKFVKFLQSVISSPNL